MHSTYCIDWLQRYVSHECDVISRGYQSSGGTGTAVVGEVSISYFFILEQWAVVGTFLKDMENIFNI